MLKNIALKDFSVKKFKKYCVKNLSVKNSKKFSVKKVLKIVLKILVLKNSKKLC